MSQRILVIIILILLVVSCVLGSLWFFAGGDEKAKGTIEAAAKKMPEVKEIDVNAYEYVALRPLILPVMGRDGATETVSMAITLEVKDIKYADEAKALEPKLTDAFVTVLYGKLSHDHMKHGDQAIDVVLVKRELKRVIEEILGEHKVNEVLVQVIQQHGI